jgi:hypothetical protein
VRRGTAVGRVSHRICWSRYDNSDDEGHDDFDVDESRSSTSDDSDADARGNLRDFAILIHYTFSSFPLVHLAIWHVATLFAKKQRKVPGTKCPLGSVHSAHLRNTDVR